MKRIVSFALLLLFAATAQAAVRFHYRQTSRSDFQSAPPSDITATAVLDGTRSRIDFKSGGGYAKGSYMIADQFTGNATLVDPGKGTYSEMNLGSQLSSAARNGVSIANLKSEVKRLADRPVIAGLPTEHYRVEISYEMTMVVASLPLRQTVTTAIEEWSTSAFGDVRNALQNSSALRTGNPQLDELLQAEVGKLRGLPLRQVVTITTRSESKRVPNSKLQINPTKSQVSEMIVTAIETVPGSELLFVVPSTYRRIDESRTDGTTNNSR